MVPERVGQVSSWLDPSAKISTDDKPLVVARALAFVTTRVGPSISTCIRFFEKWQALFWAMIPLMAGVALSRRSRVVFPFWGMGVVGFTQMAFQIMVILGVQVFFGHAYALVGGLTAGFMLGAFVGAQASLSVFNGRGFLQGLLMQACLAVLLIACWSWWPQGLFVFPILSGYVGGVLFRAYAALAGSGRAGQVYAVDLIGAALGALFVGLFGIAFWGVTATMVFVAALNIVMLAGCLRENSLGQ
jgi:hypothetical protein